MNWQLSAQAVDYFAAVPRTARSTTSGRSPSRSSSTSCGRCCCSLAWLPAAAPLRSASSPWPRCVRGARVARRPSRRTSPRGAGVGAGARRPARRAAGRSARRGAAPPRRRGAAWPRSPSRPRRSAPDRRSRPCPRSRRRSARRRWSPRAPPRRRPPHARPSLRPVRFVGRIVRAGTSGTGRRSSSRRRARGPLTSGGASRGAASFVPTVLTHRWIEEPSGARTSLCACPASPSPPAPAGAALVIAALASDVRLPSPPTLAAEPGRGRGQLGARTRSRTLGDRAAAVAARCRRRPRALLSRTDASSRPTQLAGRARTAIAARDPSSCSATPTRCSSSRRSSASPSGATGGCPAHQGAAARRRAWRGVRPRGASTPSATSGARPRCPDRARAAGAGGRLPLRPVPRRRATGTAGRRPACALADGFAPTCAGCGAPPARRRAQDAPLPPRTSRPAWRRRWATCALRVPRTARRPAPPRRRGGRAGPLEVIDPTDRFCLADACPAVIGDVLVYRNTGHITATYTATLAPWLDGGCSRRAQRSAHASSGPRPCSRAATPAATARAPTPTDAIVSFAVRRSPRCVYGERLPETESPVVLFGDSHALQYFPAVERSRAAAAGGSCTSPRSVARAGPAPAPVGKPGMPRVARERARPDRRGERQRDRRRRLHVLPREGAGGSAAARPSRAGHGGRAPAEGDRAGRRLHP